MLSLVTGGAGFIGSHLAEKLISLGHEVIILDDFSTGREQNLVEIEDHSRLRVCKVDVCDETAIQPHFLGVDWVFHLAALADIVPSIQEPLTYLRAGIGGTQAVLEASRLANVKRLVYAASSSCYGIPDLYPTPESSPISPQYPYALAKNLGEQIVMHWGQVYDLPVVSLRLFNVYGTRSRTSGAYGAVFGVFLAQKLAGKPFTVVGDGSQTRDFTYVEDVVRGILATVNSDWDYEIINLGSDQPHSINTVIELIEKKLGKKANRQHLDPDPADVPFTQASTDKAHQLLDWLATTNLHDGIEKTCVWYKNNRDWVSTLDLQEEKFSKQ